MKFKLRVIGILFSILTMCCDAGKVTYASSVANYNLNVAVVGDPGVGKKTLIEKLCMHDQGGCEVTRLSHIHHGNKFDINFFGMDMELEAMEQLPVDHQYANLLPSCHCALIVFDLSEGETLAKGRIQRWKEVIKSRSPLCDVIFIENKEDLISSDSERERLGMPIAAYAVFCEREEKYPGARQDFASISTSAINGTGLIKILRHICEWGPVRVSDFEKYYGSRKQKAVELINLEFIAKKILMSDEVIQATIKAMQKKGCLSEISLETFKNILVNRITPGNWPWSW